MPEKNNATAAAAHSKRDILVNAQYIKDFSFENPNAPQSLVPPKSLPKIEVSVDVRIQKMDTTTFEVTLVTIAKASTEETALFLTELAYSGIFTLNMPAEEIEPVLMVYCPSLLFPFARQIIADASRQGGFPPLQIDPIDFGSLYKQHKMQQAAR